MSGSMRAVIPEMDSFDQEELELNPVLNVPEAVPLLGALLVSEGLITREQLNTCLLAQQRHPGEPLGQILIRHGYLSERDLNHALMIQQEIKALLIAAIAA